MKKIRQILCLLMIIPSVIWANVRVGQMAPDFRAIDANGKTVQLSDFKGKVVVLEWSNFECPFVRKHYSSGNMQATQKKATKDDVVWLMIFSNAQGKQGYYEGSALRKRLADEKVQATYALRDESGKIGRLYGAKTTPHMYVISKDGKIAYQGAIDSIRSANPKDIARADNYVLDAIASLRANKEVNPSQTIPYGCSVKYTR